MDLLKDCLRFLATNRLIPLERICPILAILYFFFASGNSALTVILLVRGPVIVVVFYGTVLRIIRRLYFRHDSLPYLARDRTRRHLATGSALTFLLYSSVLTFSIWLLSTEETLKTSAVNWAHIQTASTTVVNYSTHNLTSLHSHSAASAYTCLVAACRVAPGMTVAIEDRWDMISNISPVLVLDRGPLKCWRQNPLHHPIRSPTKQEDIFRHKALNLFDSIKDYTISVLEVEQAVDQVISNAILETFRDLTRNTTNSITKSLNTSPSFFRSTKSLWERRIMAFYRIPQDGQPSYIAFHSPVSTLKLYLRLQIRTVTYPIFKLGLQPLMSLFSSSPTLENLLFQALDARTFEQTYYTSKIHILNSIAEVKRSRQNAIHHYENLVTALRDGQLEDLTSKHVDFLPKFLEMDHLIVSSSSTNFSSGDDQSCTDVSPSTLNPSDEITWWGVWLEIVVRDRILGKIDTLGQDVRRLRDEGRVISIEGVEEWLKLGGSQT
ncbi:hypothetical protein AC578_4027 [Pseudocercospora eumusae]|uniref:Uncharacterized protein n=1 Tax=Pseudocercospora eumusae TaxID=321146 RepID=A0A139HDV8_9PEZI|nr:hypothetical protein AC578_4027 [Pseudocercospora eumusae]